MQKLFQTILDDFLCLQEMINVQDNKPDITSTDSSKTGTMPRRLCSADTKYQTLYEDANKAESRLQELLQRKTPQLSNIVPEANLPTATTYVIIPSEESYGRLQIVKYDQTRARREVTSSDLTIMNLRNVSVIVLLS